MKKENKKRKPRKELPLALNVILVLIFVVVFVFLSICMSFLINSFIKFYIDEITINAVITLIVGIVYMILLLILIRNSDSENVQPFKWYVNCVFISFTISNIITAIFVFISGDNVLNFLIGFCMFPLTGIIATPNIVNYTKKDNSKWKGIFYNNGNLNSTKTTEDFYRVHTPVSFEKKLLSAVYKNQFLNILVVIGIMLFVIFLCVHYMGSDHSYTGNAILDIMRLRARKAAGFIFFLTIIFVTFGIPILAFYLGNAFKKIRVVRNHEYIAYHAIVSGVHNGKINIYNGRKHYSYNYCTCVGIKEKDVHFTPATLIFIPDDVFLFPDNEDFKVEKNNKKNN